MPPWVLWVHGQFRFDRRSRKTNTGNPGCGKTVLASSVIEELIDEGDSGDGLNETCYFFFNYNDSQNSTIEAAYRSALAQILHRSREDNVMLDKFLFGQYNTTSSSGQKIASSTELLDLMRVCSSEIGQICLVLDGIDESNEPDLLSRKLKDLVTTAPVKLICFSRPNINCLQKQVPNAQRVGFDREATKSDIRLFLIHHLWTLLDEGMLPQSVDINMLADTLVYGADGMFLWARLMVKYLNSPALTPNSRLETMNSVRFPEGLSAMYDRIVQLISKSGTPELSLARRILLWLSHSIDEGIGAEPHALQTAVAFEDDPSGFDHFVSVAITVCGGLVEFNPQQHFQLTHLTVGEYFADQPWSRLGHATPLVPDRTSAAVEITLRCVEYLLSHAPVQTPSKFSSPWNTTSHWAYRSTFEAYVARHWCQHLTQIDQLWLDGSESIAMKNALKLLDSISTFLQTPLAVGFWICALYKSESFVEGILEQIDDWVRLVDDFDYKIPHIGKIQHVAKHLRNLATEIRVVEKDWGFKLTQNPSLIWDDVLAFSAGAGETLSKIVEASRIRPVTTLAPKDNAGKSVQCLCTISSTSANGMLVGVLSVYSSQEFEEFWKTMNSKTVYQDAEQFCSSWIAKYELWSPDSKLRRASLDIQLPEAEILLVLRQSFRQNPFKHQNHLSMEQVQYNEGDDKALETSFPLAIGHDCLTFAILRTVYTIHQTDPESNPGKCESFLLPLEFLDHFNAKWTPHLETFNPDELAKIPEVLRPSFRDWYTYAIAFSTDGKYLSFADYQKPCITHLAVFDLLREPRFSSCLVGWTMVRNGLPRVKDMIFHPTLTLLAFLSEWKVWIWDFSRGKRSSYCIR
jgi:hypothetical protein